MIDGTLSFSLDLLRVDAHTRAEVAAILIKMQRELVARLAAGGVTAWNKARMDGQIADAGALIRDYYKQVEQAATTTTAGVYQVAASHANTLLAATTSASVPSALPVPAAMEAIASGVVVQGAIQADWWAKQAADVEFRFAAAVRQGLAAAETNQQIIARVKGELAVTRSNAAALVQTSVQTVANEARLSTYRANSDLITGLRWLATLDSHTCAQCGARDGSIWALDGAVIDADTPFINPPLHFNCRCVLVPQTEYSNLGTGQRASSSGPVDRKVKFSDYLDRQSVAFQDEVLGPGRAQMYRDGKITLQDLITSGKRPLTLEQLRARYGG